MADRRHSPAARYEPTPREGVGRRALLRGALGLPLVACTTHGAETIVPAGSDPVSSSRVDPAKAEQYFSSLEQTYDARLGVYALATGTSVPVAHRADDRFAFGAASQVVTVAAVLEQRPTSYLDTVIRYAPTDLRPASPVTRDHVDTGMAVRDLCDAALRFGDATAGNLLLGELGGPAQLTTYLRGLGDTVGRVDQYEPERSDTAPDDPRDTTTPRALAAVYQQILLRGALSSHHRSMLQAWLDTSTTGADTIRAGVPKGWTVVNMAGQGSFGRVGDVAIVRPPRDEPLVLAVQTDRTRRDAPPQNAMIADVAKYVAAVLYQHADGDRSASGGQQPGGGRPPR